ncbi:PSME3-interacting protein [Hydra vulgaris]|uniref:PSME3-interacting protein n=1 Tax=Hydra vulgaris TaxID=6087 RepID=UPI0006413623|nr:PSME3-interacting protein [Hydra vulgaris]
MNFVSEKDIEEAKKKRAEEWEKARSQGRELPQVEEESFRDTRSLYERLKEQKDKKQEEFEEQLKFKNMIYKGLNTEDASFLEMVAKKKLEMDNIRFNEESNELKEYRAALEDENLKLNLQKPTKSKISVDFKTKQKSQRELVESVIIRKRKTVDDNLAVKKCHIEEKDKDIEDKSNDIKGKAENIEQNSTDIVKELDYVDSIKSKSVSILGSNYSSSEED